MMLPMNLAPPRPPEGIDLRLCGADALLDWCEAERGDEWCGARLVHADPPWTYGWSVSGIGSRASDHYPLIEMPDIARHIARAGHVAGDGSVLVLWCTWATLGDWMAEAARTPDWPWRYVSGGAWHKSGRANGSVGIGYYWRGATEPVLIYVRGKAGRPNECIQGGHSSVSGTHSEKPIPWLREMVRAWTDPGDQVLELYAGRGSMARACAAEGRRYVGCEIDPDRHRDALGLLAGRVGI